MPSETPSSKQCGCPNGSYGVKHTPQCYEEQLTRLTQEKQAASDFMRGCIEAIGYKDQPPNGFELSTNALLDQVIGAIEYWKCRAAPETPDSVAIRELWEITDLAEENAQTGEVTFDAEAWERMLRAFWDLGGRYRQSLTELGWSPEKATELPKGCHRSHPHEDMDAGCERLTEIARAANEAAQKTSPPIDPYTPRNRPKGNQPTAFDQISPPLWTADDVSPKHCRCEFADPDGTQVPGEPCALHPGAWWTCRCGVRNRLTDRCGHCSALKPVDVDAAQCDSGISVGNERLRCQLRQGHGGNHTADRGAQKWKWGFSPPRTGGA